MENRDNQHCTLFKLVHTEDKSHVDNNGVFYCNDGDDFDECVFMTAMMFREIWGRTWSSMSQKERLLPIVEISYKGQSIYRRYRQSSAQGLHMHQLGLTQRSIGLLCSEESLVNQDVIEVKIGSEEKYFENHPHHSTRMAYQMSTYANKIGEEANRIGKESRNVSYVSLGLAILSIALTLFLTFCQG